MKLVTINANYDSEDKERYSEINILEPDEHVFLHAQE